MPHVIRLRGAWEVLPDPDRARHARHFGRPRTLDPDERLWLVCAHVPAPAAVSVNGEVVGTADAPGPFAADITARLRPRNVVEFAVPSGGELGEVTLEVRSAGESTPV